LLCRVVPGGRVGVQRATRQQLPRGDTPAKQPRILVQSRRCSGSGGRWICGAGGTRERRRHQLVQRSYTGTTTWVRQTIQRVVDNVVASSVHCTPTPAIGGIPSLTTKASERDLAAHIWAFNNYRTARLTSSLRDLLLRREEFRHNRQHSTKDFRASSTQGA
jgi:hypothetical protein